MRDCPNVHIDEKVVVLGAGKTQTRKKDDFIRMHRGEGDFGSVLRKGGSLGGLRGGRGNYGGRDGVVASHRAGRVKGDCWRLYAGERKLLSLIK